MRDFVVVGLTISSNLWCCRSATAFSLIAQPKLQHPVLLLFCANGP